MESTWFKPVAAAALARFDDVMSALGLAGGKQSGPEYLPLNPKRADNSPGSFSINRGKGAWLEGATGDQGGDLISLAAYVWSTTNGEAAERLAQQLGVAVPERQNRPRRPEVGSGKAKTSTPASAQPCAPICPSSAPDDAVCIMPIPADAPPAPALHPRHGKPTARWIYVDAAGVTMFFHDRFERDGQRKQFSPLSLWKTPAGRLVWRWKAPIAPRPLLGLDRLTARQDAGVLVVEGEKALDAAALLLPECVGITWQGGCNALEKSDWQPLAGRVVWLWPDADDPGAKVMQKLADRLRQIGAAEVRHLNLRAFAKTPVDGALDLLPGEPLAAGDDAADLIARGWRPEHLAQLIETGELFEQPEETPAAVATAVDSAAERQKGESSKPVAADDSPRRGFRLDSRGVWFVDVRNGEPAAPRWICSPLDVLAFVRDANSASWGLYVGFADPDGREHKIVIPAKTFTGEGLEAAALLLDQGLKLAPRARPLLLEYLQTSNPKARARTTNRTGWHESSGENVFVTPARSFGSGGESWIFDSDAQDANPYSERGTLPDWQKAVARRCVGNSRLVFAVCVGFASSLLRLVGAESGGWNMLGKSSFGKTVVLRVGSSICGSQEFMQRWRSTSNGLESTAMQFCDGPLMLDELAQMAAKEIGESVYMLANGTGKARAGRTGAGRPRARWRLLFLSSSEVSLVQRMAEAGEQSRAGQELRLAEIPADAGNGLGVFEALHDCASSAEFAKALESASNKNYGTAWSAWLKRLVCEPPGDVARTAREGMIAFEKRYLTEAASGQARRVAGRFALVGIAGEMASDWRITGWKAGEAMNAAGTCFQAWLAQRGGEGVHEDRAMLRQIREFLSRYGESAFSDMDRPSMTDTHAPIRSDRAGWRKHDSATDKVHYYVAYDAWRARLCKGHDPYAVARVLLERGFIEKGTEANRLWLVRACIPGEGRPRVVHILPEILEHDHD